MDANGAVQLRTPTDLQAYVTEHQINATIVSGLGATPTVPAAAAALGVAPDQIVKTLLFLIDSPGELDASPRAVVVISHGEKRIDKRRLADYWGVGKKRVNLAPAEVVTRLLRYPAGGVPPFGHLTSLPVLVDASLLTLRERFDGVIFGGGGDDCTMMRLTVDELLRVTQGEVVEMTG